MDLYGCELIGIDGSKFKGVNADTKNFSRKHFLDLLNQIEERIETYLTELETQDQDETNVGHTAAKELAQKIAALKKKKQSWLTIKARMKPGETQVSLTDPDARAMGGKRGRVVGYNVQIAVDDKYKLLAAVTVTQARADNHQLHAMTRNVKQNLGIESFEVVADKGYYKHEELAKCLQEKVTPRVPPQRYSINEQRGLFTKADFIYDQAKNCYTCPAGNLLKPLRKRKPRKRTLYRTRACKECPIRNKCTTRQGGRELSRSLYENDIDQLEREGTKIGYLQSKRRNLVEHPFGTFKANFQFGSFLTKGLANVQTEMTLAALAYNIRRVLNIQKAQQAPI